MYERIIRNSAGLIAWFLATVLSLALNGVVILANYLGCKTSYELLGFEMMPLHKDKLLGGIFQAFLGEATMAHLYALAVALTVAVGIFWLSRFGIDIYQLYCDRRDYISLGDKESAHKAILLIIRNLIFIFILAVPLAYAIKTDVGLLRYRWVAGALGIEDPRQATLALKAWELQLEENGHLFAWSLARFGAWGYIGVTAIACLAFEFSGVKFCEYFTRLANALGSINQPQSDQLFYGYDGDGQPIFDPKIPLAYDTDGNPLGTPQAPMREQPSENRVHIGATQQSSNEVPLFGDDQQDNSSPRMDEDLHDVIGGVNGERVSLNSALRNPQRYWVDPETHEVWDANYRGSLLEDES
jgi:hypothetical protein